MQQSLKQKSETSAEQKQVANDELVLKVANEWKVKGNECYKSKRHTKAKQCYKKGIQSVLNCEKYNSLVISLLCNRTLSFMRVCQWKSAILDAGSAMRMDRNSLKAWFRLISCLVELKEHSKYAKELLNTALKIFPNEQCLLNIKQALVDDYYGGNEYKSEKSSDFSMGWCSVGSVREIVEIGRSGTRRENTNRNENRDQKKNKGKKKSKRNKKKNRNKNKNKKNIKFQLQTENDSKNKNNSKSDVNSFSKMLELKNMGNAEFKLENYEKAILCYSRALLHVEVLSYLYSNHSALLYSLKKYDQAFECSTIALVLNHKNIKAFHRRANIAFNFELFDITQNICDLFPRLKQFSPLRKKLKEEKKCMNIENLEEKMEKLEGTKASTKQLSEMMQSIKEIAKKSGKSEILDMFITKVPPFHEIYEQKRKWPKCADIQKCKAVLWSAFEHASAVKMHEIGILHQTCDEVDYFMKLEQDTINKRLAYCDMRRLKWYFTGYPGLVDKEFHELSDVGLGYVSSIFHSFSNTLDKKLFYLMVKYILR